MKKEVKKMVQTEIEAEITFQVEVDLDKCTGCGLCWTECITRRIPHSKLIELGEMTVGERESGER